MIKLPYKVITVVVNNKPQQYHVSSGKWGDPPLAICDTKKDALIVARLYNSHNDILEALEWALDQVKADNDEYLSMRGYKAGIKALKRAGVVIENEKENYLG